MEEIYDLGGNEGGPMPLQEFTLEIGRILARKAEEEENRYRAALWFYADVNGYLREPHRRHSLLCDCVPCDGGERARAALRG